jgi:hypothetical protein
MGDGGCIKGIEAETERIEGCIQNAEKWKQRDQALKKKVRILGILSP